MDALLTSLLGDVRLAQGGDRAAFTRLVDGYRNVVTSITLAIVRDPGASEDVAQDAFLEAWATVHTLRNPESFLPWMRQLARNRAHEFLRSRRRYQRRHAAWNRGEAEEVADPSVSAAARMLDEEQRRLLAEALEALPEETREVVTLYYREDRSAAQVALLLDLSEEAVKKRLQRARAALREAVLERFAETVKEGAPGAAFTAVVASGLAAGGPGTASAAMLGAASVTAKSIVALAMGIAGPLAGLLSGIAGVRLGVRSDLRHARDDLERAELKRFGRQASLAIVLAEFFFAGAIVMGLLRVRPRLIASYLVLDYAAVIGVLFNLYVRRWPAIISRRRAAERAEDPAAVLRHRQVDILRILGLGLGAAVAGAGVAVAVYFLLKTAQRS